MKLRVVTGPASEIISLDEAKAHLRVVGDDEDAYIYSLIITAREMCELGSRRALMTQTLELGLECWPNNAEISLPRPPLQSVTSLTYLDSAGITQTMPALDYIVDTFSQPGRLVLGYGKFWPGATLQPGTPIRVRYVAGYGSAAQVPQYYRQAIKLLIGHFYENREAVVVANGTAAVELPLAVKSLIQMNRGGWL